MSRGGDEGQAATELALVLPLLVALLLCAAQVALVARDQILVVHAAREAARQAAVGATPAAVRAAAARAAGVKVGSLTTDTSYQGGPPDIVVVRVRFRSFTDIPLVGPLLPDPVLWAKAAMRPELGHGS
ncbi:MAG: pilus assembly protein [Actinomycetota bacterium]|nr:pilus assembly protein [Actinomycetota bacterium]